MNTMKYPEGSISGKMNGRMYDPVVSRFISPDPFIQSPSQSESFNRYSYCMNNPMRFTDPSGYVSFGQEARDRALRMELKAAQERLDAEHAYYYSSALNANLDYGGYLHGYGSNGNFTAIYTNSSGALLGMGVSQGSAFDENYTLSSQGIEYMNSLGFNGFVRGSNGDYWASYNTMSAGKWSGSMETCIYLNDRGAVGYVNLTAMMGNGLGQNANAYLSVFGGIVDGLEQSYKYGDHTEIYAQRVNGITVKPDVLTRYNKINATKMASGLRVVGGVVTGLSVAASTYEFLNSDMSGNDVAKLVSGVAITATAFIPVVGPIISIGLGVADSYGAFDGIYNYFD